MEQVGLGDTNSLIEQLGKTIVELEAHKNASKDRVQWIEIEQHFCNLEHLFKKKLEELDARGRDFEEKETEACTMLAERETVVAAKEQDLLDRIQELKDAAVAAIVAARANNQSTSVEAVDDGSKKESKVSSSVSDAKPPREEFTHKSGENMEVVAVKGKPQHELAQFCKQMDAKGLLNYTMENKKIFSVIREELSAALKSAAEPARLVLDTLAGFYPPDETTEPGDKRVATLQGMRKSCLIFMEAMATLLGRVDPGAQYLLNPQTKQQAKAIADEWKPKLASSGNDAANGNSLEAEAFLQLLATFRIASEFDEEELCKLVLAVAHRRQATELCRAIGLTQKVPDFIDYLIKNGKQIAAVHFIQAFQLSERYPPVPLLKAYLKELRRNSQGKGGTKGGVSGGQNDANSQELAALKSIIRCVQEYKLESDYPLDSLQKRVAQLEKSKADRKRSGDFGRHQQSKKPKTKGGRGFLVSHAASAAAASSVSMERQTPYVRVAYAGIAERYLPSVRNNYQIPGEPLVSQQNNEQRSYYYPLEDRPPQQSNDQIRCYYPLEDRPPPAAYNTGPPSYGGYVGGSLHPHASHQPYM